MTARLHGLLKNVVHVIARPPRSWYHPWFLGPTSFSFGGRRFHRTDHVLRSERNARLQCSHWQPAREERLRESLPCVVFVHANSAARLQALHYLSFVLSLGCTLFVFDCAGSGLTDGQYVTLGLRERHDLATVIRYLRSLREGSSSHSVSKVVVWGCSMGAASTIMHHGDMRRRPLRASRSRPTAVQKHGDADALHVESAVANAAALNTEDCGCTGPVTRKFNFEYCGTGHESDDEVEDFAEWDVPQFDDAPSLEADAVILDSPYSDFEQLALDVTEQKLGIGASSAWVVTQMVLSRIDTAVQETASFSIYDLRPIQHVESMKMPALFLHAKEDKLLSVNHIHDLMKVGGSCVSRWSALMLIFVCLDFQKYGGPCALVKCEGAHSAHPREHAVLGRIGAFLRTSLALPADIGLPAFADDTIHYDLMPWAYGKNGIFKKRGLVYGLHDGPSPTE